MSAAVLQGKLSCAKKGIAFCKNQLCSAATKFKAALAGSDYEECLNINDGSENDGDDDDGFDDANYDSTGDCSDDEFANNNVPESEMWLHSSVGRASHRYRGGHGFESR